MPERNPSVRSPGAATTKRCPYCDEVIRAHAIVCRYCGTSLSSDRARSPGVVRGLAVAGAVVVAGAVPALWNLSLLYDVRRGIYLPVYFGLQLLALGLGVCAGALWSTARTTQVSMLALCSGAVEVVLGQLVVDRAERHGNRLALGTEDYVAWAGTVLLFGAGMFTATRFAQRRRAEESAAPYATKGSGSQDLVRTAIAVTGVAISAYATFSKS